MKTLITCFFTLIFIMPFFSNGQDSTENFFGMWTISTENGTVGWLNVHKDNGYLDAELLWESGSVLPVSNIYFEDHKNLVVTRSNEQIIQNGENVRKLTSCKTFTFSKKNNRLKGVAIFPSRDRLSAKKTKFTAWKLPFLTNPPDLSKVKYGQPIELFNGKDIANWKLINTNHTNGFKVVDGILINDPVQIDGKRITYGNIRTINDFNDFNLKLEVNIPKGSNSGIYLRGMYEIQVRDSYGRKLDSHNMGGVYSRITPSVSAEKPAGKWQKLDITLCQRHITVKLNDITIIDNQPVYGPTGGAIIADVFKPGPIYLQGDHGKVSYKNIVLIPILN